MTDTPNDDAFKSRTIKRSMVALEQVLAKALDDFAGDNSSLRAKALAIFEPALRRARDIGLAEVVMIEGNKGKPGATTDTPTESEQALAQTLDRRMTLNEYQDFARKTALYPGLSLKEDSFSVQGATYTALGLAGEAGEVANKVKKILRDDNSHLTHERLFQIRDELGGVLWYVAMLSHELGISLESVARNNIRILEAREKRGTLHGDGDER